MLKRILLSLVLLLVTAYLCIAVTVFNRKPANQVCRDMELIIKDTVYAGLSSKILENARLLRDVAAAPYLIIRKTAPAAARRRWRGRPRTGVFH